MKGPPSDTPNLEDTLSRDFAAMLGQEENTVSEVAVKEGGEETQPTPTRHGVFQQPIHAVEERSSFAVKAPVAESKPEEENERPPTPAVDVKNTPTSTFGDDFDVEW